LLFFFSYPQLLFIKTRTVAPYASLGAAVLGDTLPLPRSGAAEATRVSVMGGHYSFFYLQHKKKCVYQNVRHKYTFSFSFN
jgi:hypothetical protein